MTRIFCTAALAAASLATILAAPQAQPPTFTGGNKTVAVYATVTNAQQRLITDLKKEDFTIEDNAKRQELTLFSERSSSRSPSSCCSIAAAA